MTTRAGETEGETSIEAAKLTQQYVGLAYGANRGDGVVYGQIAAFEIGPDAVTVVNAGVPGDHPLSVLVFALDEPLHFIR